MDHTSLVLLISFVLVALGVILLVLRGRVRDKVILTTDQKSQLNDDINEIIIMNPSGRPDLMLMNGAVGTKMVGTFARKNAPSSCYAAYNCFHILFCPILTRGCYLIEPMVSQKEAVRCYGELKIEKNELFYLLAKGWGILLIVAGALVALIELIY